MPIKFWIGRFLSQFSFIIFLLLIIIGLDTFQKGFLQEVNLKRLPSSIETNLIRLDLQKFRLGKDNSQIVFASRAIDTSTTEVFSAERRYGSIQQSVINNDKLVVKNHLELTEIIQGFQNFGTSFYIFDLEMDSKDLYISLIPIDDSPLPCSKIILVKVPIDNSSILQNSGTIVWDSKVCIDVETYTDNLYQFQGKLLLNSENIYMATGNINISTFALNTETNDQNLDLLDSKENIFGKVLEINKFTGYESIFASGLRSPGGLTFSDFQSRESLYVVDHGPRGGDEINLSSGGEHFGWPLFTHGIPYDPDAKNSMTKFNTFSEPGFVDPIYFWSPSIAPSALIVLPERFGFKNFWEKHSIVMGSLKSESIFHLVILGDKVINVEQIKIGQRLRDMSFTNGAILVSTDSGALLKFTPSEASVSGGAFPVVYPNNSFYTKIYLFKNLSSLVDEILDRIAGVV